MTAEQIDIELSEIAEKIRPLTQRADALNREKRRLLSLAFISANGVTKDNIEMSGGDCSDGKPYFGHITNFSKWLRETNCQKRFCEWNGLIYFTAEIAAGRMERNAAGRVEDVS